MLKRLRSKRGETLVETLAAILVFSLASIMLFSMLSSAADINRTVQETREKNEQELESIERQTGGTAGSVLIEFEGKDPIPVTVTEYGSGEAGAFYSYGLTSDD